MRSGNLLHRILPTGVMAFVLVIGCTPRQDGQTQDGGDDHTDGMTTDDMNDGNTDSGDGTTDIAPALSENETDGIDAALGAVGALSDATTTTQGATQTDNAVSGQVIPGLPQPVIQPVTTFGQCPEITLNLTATEALAFDVSVDFGESCQPVESANLTCGGNASGALNGLNSTIAIQFNDVTCNNNTLAGSAQLIYGVSETSVELSGAWDLDWTIEDDVYSTTGDGTSVYDRTTSQIAVVTFTGTITEEDGTWNFSADQLLIAPADHSSLIPYSGTLTLEGDGGRPVVVTFSETSPATGIVTVSIDGSPAVEVNLFTL